MGSILSGYEGIKMPSLKKFTCAYLHQIALKIMFNLLPILNFELNYIAQVFLHTTLTQKEIYH